MPTSTRNAVVITVSDRCARGDAEDRSGSTLVRGLKDLGFVVTLQCVPDGVPAVRDAVTEAVKDGAAVVLTTGGTGVGPRDVTPEAVAPMLTQTLPGLADSVRMAGADAVPTAVLSRGVAGIIRVAQPHDDGTWAAGGGTVVVTLPGSVGGVRDGLTVVGPLLGHLIDQLAGGDHAG